MAAKYFAIGDAKTNYVLLEKNTNNTATQYTGLVNSIRICNHSDNPATVTLFIKALEDPYTEFFVIKNVVIPSTVVLELNNDVSFNVNTHSLKLTNSGTDPKLTIRIE